MRIIVMPGDGIGPEITATALEVTKAASCVFGLDLTFDHEDVGFVSLKKHGTTLQQDLLEHAKGYDGIILGTQSHADYPPAAEGGRNVSAGFRVVLDLFANVRPARTRSGVPHNKREGRNMDLVIMREAKAAAAMEAAVDKALADPAARTRDLGGSSNCDAFGARVAAELEKS
jgi:3-isopropylmalate dehydrogenase